MSKIEWTEITWNPATGCNKISDGCKYCYAERMATRLKSMGMPKYSNGFRLSLHEELIDEPMKWHKPCIVFVNSMSDLFHEKIPFDFIKQVFNVMNNTPHVYQILTKRSYVLKKFTNKLTWTDNIWMGVSVESNDYLYRIDDLMACDAKVKFLSLEPLLTDLHDLELEGIDWVIVGGESGPGAREMQPDWVIDIYQKCKDNNIPFFFKQWGGVNKKKNGRIFNGQIYNEMPDKYYHIENTL